MMYSNRFVLAVKVGGQVLREANETVALPFGSEYSLLLKNLNSVRSQVSVSIDGQDVAGHLVVGANQDLELERYIRNGNLEAGNRFKFIKHTKATEAHRGIKAEDGIVRVEYTFEKAEPEVVERIVRDVHVPYYDRRRSWPLSPRPRFGVPMRGMRTASNRRFEPVGEAMASLDSGFTVAGSESNQKFRYVSGFPLESQSHVIVLKLVGTTAKGAVATPVTVNQKSVCEICGKKNKPGNKCCVECGAALQLI